MRYQRSRLLDIRVVRRPTLCYPVVVLTSIIMMTMAVLFNGRNIHYAHPNTNFQRMSMYVVTGWTRNPVHAKRPRASRITTSSTTSPWRRISTFYPIRLSSMQQQKLYSSSDGNPSSVMDETTTTSVSLLKPLPSTPYDDGQCPYQITTPIYYVNDKPHIGHAYTSTGKFLPCRSVSLPRYRYGHCFHY